MPTLELRPLLSDLGDHFSREQDVFAPTTTLVLSGDERILGQFSHYPQEFQVHRHIEAMPLPDWMGVLIKGAEYEWQHDRNDPKHDLKIVYAKQLKALVLFDGASEANRAVKAFINELRDSTVVILRWKF